MYLINFCLNDTSWDKATNAPIPGGQGERYYQTVWDALDSMGVRYEISRQPIPGVVNVYLNNRDRYKRSCAFREFASVHTSHGIADKLYRSDSLTRSFTHMIVPGPAHEAKVLQSGADRRGKWFRQKHGQIIRVFEGIRINVLGYPKLDPLFQNQVKGDHVWAMDGRTRVLYAPTHGGGSEAHRDGNRNAPGARATSWWHKDDILSALPEEDFEVVLAPHPRHSAGHRGTFDQYVHAEVVIADGGSTIYESLVQDIPVVFPDWLTRARNLERGAKSAPGTLEQDVYEQGIGFHVRTPEALPDAVRQAAFEGLSDTDIEFAESILPSRFRGVSGRLWAEHIAAIADMSYGTPIIGVSRRYQRNYR